MEGIELHILAQDEDERDVIMQELAEFCEQRAYLVSRLFWRNADSDDIEALNER